MLRILNPSKLLLITNQSNRKLLLFLYFQIQPRFLSDSVTPPILVPNHQQISQLILEQKSPHQALQTFQWATKIPTFTHTPSTYRALIHKLCTFRHFDIVENLLDEMPSSIGLHPDDDIFVTIVRGFGRAGMIKEVIGVLELVSKYGTGGPTLKVLNSILDVLVKEDIDIAREFYRKKMMGSGDDYTYGILMKGFCLTNRIGDGFKLLQVMKNHEVKPNVVVYNTLIHALCKNGKVGRARSLMNEMREFSDVTFNTLISAYCNENNLVQVLVMMEKCFGYGFVPDVVTLTKAVEVLCNAGRISDAVEVFDKVEGNGGTIDVVAHNTLIKGFVKAGKVKAGRGFIKQMEMKGCLPNTETYNILIAGFCDSGMLDSALDMFHEMKRVGVNCNFATFDTLIYGLCSCGRTRDGIKILELMSERRESFAHIDPYNSILYGFYKENCLDNALEFLNDMRNMFPRAVDKSLRILQLTEEGNTDEAKNVLESMREEGCIPNALIYASLVPGFCRNGCMKEAVELTNEVIELRYFPTASTFNALFDGFCQRGKARTALRLMEDLKMRSILPDSESYSIIINGFCSEKDMNQALMLLMDMIERGFVPDNSLWNVMIVAMLEGNTMLQEHKLMLSLI